MLRKSLLLHICIIVAMLQSANSYAENPSAPRGKFLIFGGLSALGGDKDDLAGIPSQTGNLLNFSNARTGNLPPWLENGDKVTSFELDPSLSYFVRPGVAIGINVLFVRTSVKNYSQTQWGIGPQIMYFFRKNTGKDAEQKKALPFVRGAVTYLMHKTIWQSFAGPWRESIPQGRFHIGFGSLYMFSYTVGLFGEASFELDRYKEGYEGYEGFESVSETKINNRFNIIIGLAGFF